MAMYETLGRKGESVLAIGKKPICESDRNPANIEVLAVCWPTLATMAGWQAIIESEMVILCWHYLHSIYVGRSLPVISLQFRCLLGRSDSISYIPH